ncbi:pentapeptide repeat-containing protein [Francisellaceae bacterium CB52]
MLYDDKRKERFVEVETVGFRHWKKYYLIEHLLQINVRCEKELYDFYNHIFTCEADFTNDNFKNKANFGNTIFEKKARFLGCIFMKDVDFNCATFNLDVYFFGAKFWGKTNFLGAKFKEIVSFSSDDGRHKSCFEGDVDFSWATFEKPICFSNCIFEKSVNFSNVTFEANVNFLNVSFERDALFRNADIKSKFLISGINNKDKKYESFNLDLTAVSPSYIDYNNINVSKVTDRKTWLVLKQAAIKQNDHISALEFHKKEMLQYTDDLKKSANKNIKDIKESAKTQSLDNQSNNGEDKDNKIVKDKKENFISKIFKFIGSPFCFIYLFIEDLIFGISKCKGARLILLFEKHASDFGTNAFKSIYWIFILIIVFGFIIFMILSLAIADVKWEYFFNFCLHSLLPTNFASNIFIEKFPAVKVYFENHYTIIFLIDFINLIKNILVGVLIYETIKSFRRFSRKL